MTTIQTTARVGPDRRLHLDLSPNLPGGDVRVTVILEPVSNEVRSSAADDPELEASRRFVREIAGTWEGEPLVRPPQLA